MDSKILKKIREENNYSQKYIAEYLSVSRPTYVSIEQGERELTVSEFQKLSKLFDLSLDELVSGKKTKEYKVELKESQTKAKPEKQAIRIVMEKANVDKFKEVLLYVLEKVGGKSNIGETVLYKLLYFIDFDFYEKFEEQLTGARYMKNHHGPTPIEFAKIIESMIKNNELEKIKSSYFEYGQKKYLPHRSPDLSKLTAREIVHIDEVLARLSDKSAKELSEYSHDDIPWKIHEQGEEIDYESVFYRDNKYSQRNYSDEI